MERMLYESAVTGSVPSLLNLINKDPLVLERFMTTCFRETPLHIASMLGNLEFTAEILRRKPQLAGELDLHRQSPLHLATANGHHEVVKALLLVNPEMCLIQDRHGRNPLHVAVIKGRFEILQELVRTKPDAVYSRGKNGESLLHLCATLCQLDALKFLIERINDDNFLNSIDNNGFTALDLAVLYKQNEIINFLASETKMEATVPKGIENIVVSPENERPEIVFSSPVHISKHRNSSQLKRRRRPTMKQRIWLEQKRNALMIVASLIATMAFQAGTNPPGSVWQDDSNPNSRDSHEAGNSIMAKKFPDQYTYFVAYNTTGFVASLGVILLLISGLPFRRRIFMWSLMVITWVAITSMIVAYSIAVGCLSTGNQRAYMVIAIIVIVLDGLIAVVLVGHLIRLIIKVPKFAKGLMSRWRSSGSVVSDIELSA